MDFELGLVYIIEHAELADSQFPNRWDVLKSRRQIHQALAAACANRRLVHQLFFNSGQDDTVVVGS